MTKTASLPPVIRNPKTTWTDERLVRECVKGNEEAWAALIDKYKGLIFSIPIRYGASREDAADVFQAVCLELFSELSNLRKVESLRSWLITVAAHKSYHWKQKQRRQSNRETGDLESADSGDTAYAPTEMIMETEREQMVREAIANLPARCRCRCFRAQCSKALPK